MNYTGETIAISFWKSIF